AYNRVGEWDVPAVQASIQPKKRTLAPLRWEYSIQNFSLRVQPVFLSMPVTRTSLHIQLIGPAADPSMQIVKCRLSLLRRPADPR
ncbi:MAG TPA: hypothetical protein VIR02_19895, partial [Anaerolineales bacterium]